MKTNQTNDTCIRYNALDIQDFTSWLSCVPFVLKASSTI